MWKTMLVVVVVLLVAALVVTVNYALEDESVRGAKKRIRTYRVVAEEQRLIREILEDKIAVAKIQAMVQPPSVKAQPKDPNSPK